MSRVQFENRKSYVPPTRTAAAPPPDAETTGEVGFNGLEIETGTPRGPLVGLQRSLADPPAVASAMSKANCAAGVLDG